MTRWPCFYYPTTVLFVDDNKGFLKILKSRLPNDFPIKLFNDPIKALDVIENQKINNLNNIQLIDQEYDDFESDLTSQSFVGLRYDVFCKVVYDKQRFTTQSVVVVDQMMPDLDGINFCIKLKNHPIKKIMLTGNSDYEIAVQAFNDGLIDYYLSKDSSNLIPQLIQKIKILQKTYFESEIERSIGCLLSTDSLINDVSSLSFYEKITEDLQAIEYYLIDRSGSMLFLNCDGTPTILAINSIKTLDAFSKIAEDQDESNIAAMLSKREKILFFPNQEDHMRSASEWESFLYPASPFPGKSNFFYSIIKDPTRQPINLNKIIPFQEKIAV